MTLLKSLEKIASKDDSNKTTKDLIKLVSDIEDFSKSHLKRVFQILTEFDLHDELHCQKVISNIEHLLGDEKIELLNSYEIFLLLASCHLHDCAMAPAEWELHLMGLTEGFDKFHINEESIKNDLKPIYKYSEALLFISENWLNLNINMDWQFCPQSEDELKKELAQLFIDYQSYRNGHKDSLEKVSSTEDFKTTNNTLRINFIRKNHHIRIEKYIKNLAHKFGSILNQSAWGKKISNDLAIICRSHGEDLKYISKLDVKTYYLDAQPINLQFIAMMLRIGDIIHFSYDRAPSAIFKGKVFYSDYSFHEWAIKNNGINYDINNGVISFKAYCTNPNDYFKLHKYIDYIDKEIQNHFLLSRKWTEKYKLVLAEKVNREGIINDDEEFLPKRGLSFKLNQKQILELLMGTGLYKDKYASLREIYQNALDACRTLKASMGSLGLDKKFKIEFGIKSKNNKTFLYCHDNGIGMDENIIENYLLNIGNSFYKSAQFYREQANWPGVFTPTSQFGIGILSCFMLGNRIDISTKKYNGKMISCSIEGPHESFYYRKNDVLDDELIGESGTIIKIFLSPETECDLVANKVEHHLLINFLHSRIHNLNNIPKELEWYADSIRKWSNHLSYKLNDFINSPFDDIPVIVKIDNNDMITIDKKPYLVDYRDFDLHEHIHAINTVSRNRFSSRDNENYSTCIDSIKNYKINIAHEGIIFNGVIALPIKNSEINDISSIFNLPVIDNRIISVDGISVHDRGVLKHNGSLSKIARLGCLNFTGKSRPQISVDRTVIINMPMELEQQAEELALKIIKYIIEVIELHIKENEIELDKKEFTLCIEYIFTLLSVFNAKLIPYIIESCLGNAYWGSMSLMLKSKMSIRDFIKSKDIEIFHPNLLKKDDITSCFIHSKLCSAKEIIVNDNTMKIIEKDDISLEEASKIYEEHVEDDEYKVFFAADEWNVSNTEYDIVTSALPVVPLKLFNVLDGNKDDSNCRVKIRNFGNGITTFLTQDPILVHPKMGLFSVERSLLHSKIKKSNVFNFEKRKKQLHLSGIEGENFLNNDTTKRTWLYVYISPSELSQEDEHRLQSYLDEEEYIRGVRNGWSVLVTGMSDSNIIISAGVKKREELIKLIPTDFWDKYQTYSFRFCDGTIIN